MTQFCSAGNLARRGIMRDIDRQTGRAGGNYPGFLSELLNHLVLAFCMGVRQQQTSLGFIQIPLRDRVHHTILILTIHFKMISSTQRFSKWSLSLRFPHQHTHTHTHTHTYIYIYIYRTIRTNRTYYLFSIYFNN